MKTVIHYTDTTGFGGAEKVLLTQLQGLDPSRWRPVLLYHPQPSVELLAEEARERGVDVVPVPRPMSDGEAALVSALVRAIRQQRADVFHAHLTWSLCCTHGLLAAFIARVPRVATQHLFVFGHVGPSRRRRQRIMSAFVNRYIAVSNAMAAELGAALTTTRKVRVVHNGIEVERFDRIGDRSLRSALTAGRPCPLILTVARLDAQKGLQHLIAAAQQLPEAVFVVAGEGAERGELERELHRAGINNRFHLLGHRTDIPDLLAACDVFVLPSLFEGLPLSVLEAMAARRPVVASAVEGTAEAVVDGTTGLLVPPGNPDALAAAIRSITDDAALGRRLGTAGRLRVEQEFSARAMVHGVENVYAELLGSRRHFRVPAWLHARASAVQPR